METRKVSTEKAYEIINKYADDLVAFLIRELDLTYPNTEVARLPMPERTVMTRRSVDRLLAFLKSSVGASIQDFQYYHYPSITQALFSIDASRKISNTLDSDFLFMRCVFSFVLDKCDELSSELGPVLDSLLLAFSRLFSSNMSGHLSALELEIQNLVVEGVSANREQLCRSHRRKLLPNIRSLLAQTETLFEDCGESQVLWEHLSQLKHLEKSVEDLLSQLETADGKKEVASIDKALFSDGYWRRADPSNIHPLFPLLSARETEVAELVIDGKTNNEISEMLVITNSTVKNHLRSIYQKL